MTIPLFLLETFVAVARSGRMRDAAQSLSLTPGAISQRVRELEDMTGQRLFVRTAKGVSLTEAGQALFTALDEPFRRIDEARRGLSQPSAHRVRVSAMASFAVSWLVPRLPRFSALHPHIDIELETDSRVIDLKREPVDVAIRHGLGDYPGLVSVPLIAPELIVVASPRLLNDRATIKTPADCLAFPLLHDLERADWRLWFAAHGVTIPAQLPGSAFSEDHLMVRAAVAGQGLALVRDTYADDDLRAGRLIRALSIQWPTAFAYYAVSRPEALQRPAVAHFRDWLVEEAGAAQG
ncbi:LysR substrate-binding domain-containing protein [Pleomorphomonas sp. PLEO]|uniref:LysR substrate-binding domain-containing protein n=1 Tax=Pleomorphomonas sp. PLEO TaxID=3239306 RepID=UPI00351DD92D